MRGKKKHLIGEDTKEITLSSSKRLGVKIKNQHLISIFSLFFGFENQVDVPFLFLCLKLLLSTAFRH